MIIIMYTAFVSWAAPRIYDRDAFLPINAGKNIFGHSTGETPTLSGASTDKGNADQKSTPTSASTSPTIMDYEPNEIMEIRISGETFKNMFAKFELLTEFISTLIPDNSTFSTDDNGSVLDQVDNQSSVVIKPTEVPSVISFSSKYTKVPVVLNRHKMRLYLPSIDATIHQNIKSNLKYVSEFETNFSLYIKNLEVSLDLEFKKVDNNLKMVVSKPFINFDVFYTSLDVKEDSLLKKFMSAVFHSANYLINTSIINNYKKTIGSAQLETQLQTIFDEMVFSNLFNINELMTNATVGLGGLPWFYTNKGKSMFVFPLGFKMVKDEQIAEDEKPVVLNPYQFATDDDVDDGVPDSDGEDDNEDPTSGDVKQNKTQEKPKNVTDFYYAPNDDRIRGSAPIVRAGIVNWNSDPEFIGDAAITAFLEANTVY